MSASSILASLTSEVANTLGNDWSELKYIYDVESNDFRSTKKGYGVGIETTNTVSGTNKAATYDMGVFVVLTDKFNNRAGDENQRTTLTTLLDAKELLDVEIFQKKLNNSSVLVVQSISMDAPEVVDDNTLSLRFNYIIKYRQEV